jgi:hypothetical protein
LPAHLLPEASGRSVSRRFAQRRISLQDRASKGRSGRIIPINRELRQALVKLRSTPGGRQSRFVVTTERSAATSALAIVNLFVRWYAVLGFQGCSSHEPQRSRDVNHQRRAEDIDG